MTGTGHRFGVHISGSKASSRGFLPPGRPTREGRRWPFSTACRTIKRLLTQASSVRLVDPARLSRSDPAEPPGVDLPDPERVARPRPGPGSASDRDRRGDRAAARQRAGRIRERRPQTGQHDRPPAGGRLPADHECAPSPALTAAAPVACLLINGRTCAGSASAGCWSHDCDQCTHVEEGVGAWLLKWCLLRPRYAPSRPC